MPSRCLRAGEPAACVRRGLQLRRCGATPAEANDDERQSHISLCGSTRSHRTDRCQVAARNTLPKVWGFSGRGRCFTYVDIGSLRKTMLTYLQAASFHRATHSLRSSTSISRHYRHLRAAEQLSYRIMVRIIYESTVSQDLIPGYRFFPERSDQQPWHQELHRYLHDHTSCSQLSGCTTPARLRGIRVFRQVPECHAHRPQARSQQLRKEGEQHERKCWAL